MSEIHRPEIIVLASGSGSTAEAFVHASQAGIVKANVGLVVSNNREAGVFSKVRRLNKQYDLGIKSIHISGTTHPEGAGKKGEQTLAESAAICEVIDRGGFALVALMGYMKKVRGRLLQEYGDIMINTHPGPLPETKGCIGIDAQREVLARGLGYSAQTLHMVTSEYDAGPVIEEHRVPVMHGDTAETLFEAVQLTEKIHLPADINSFIHANNI